MLKILGFKNGRRKTEEKENSAKYKTTLNNFFHMYSSQRFQK